MSNIEINWNEIREEYYNDRELILFKSAISERRSFFENSLYMNSFLSRINALRKMELEIFKMEICLIMRLLINKYNMSFFNKLECLHIKKKDNRCFLDKSQNLQLILKD